MEKLRVEAGDGSPVWVPVHEFDAVIVGSGAAGLNAALRLHQLGQTRIAIVTEGVNVGTSRNTGSDKQTYYKLTLSGGVPDSPLDMARDLFQGRCVDGDHALVEAALSARCFLQLCELGVEFPTNRWGEYVGYRTDHDPRARATSAGPLTSQRMTECLQRAVQERNIPVYDGCQVIEILHAGERACGVLTLCHEGMGEEATRFAIFAARSIVYATGGPAGVYADSVYPEGHCGSSGAAFLAGACGRNLTEWQYGLASIAPRWNVSGTYMQALPRFISVDADGVEREFLREAFADEAECLSMVFRKGYEWPFDSQKASAGSSRIDLLVYRESVLRKRRVFLDYRQNPFGCESIAYGALAAEPRDYLAAAGACFGAPIDRLLHMNAPAYELYRSKGVDLRCEPLEIALCAQHHNGGLEVDAWWRTNIAGLYAVGEVAGTHGVYRPGGSALNAGQVGSLRAAQHIAAHAEETAEPVSPECMAEAVRAHVLLCRALLRGSSNAEWLLEQAQQRMSASGAAIRRPEGIEEALGEVCDLLGAFAERVSVASGTGLREAYRLRDTLVTQRVLLTALCDYIAQGGNSRGSALYGCMRGSVPEGLNEAFRFLPDEGALDAQVQIVQWQGGEVRCRWRAVRPIPEAGGVFETVWRGYRENQNIE